MNRDEYKPIKNTYSVSSPVEYWYSQMLRKLYSMNWMFIFNLIGVWALVGMMIAILAGGLRTMSQMNNMERGMDDMNTQMKQGSDAATKFIVGLKGKFPTNQPEVTTRQILGIVENIHKMTARTSLLLENVDQNSVSGLVTNANKFMNGIDENEIAVAKGHIFGVIERVHSIVAKIEPDSIKAITDSIAKLDPVVLNKFIDATSKLEEKVNESGGIKLSL